VGVVFRALNVVKRFGPTVALDGVSVEFGSGLNLLLGPNGSGKSTLLKLWCGLIRPARGRVEVFGLDPWARRVDVMRRVSAFFEDVPAPWWLSGEEFLRVVDKIITEKVRSGRIVVVATHILTGVERLAKGFAILHNGRVVARYPGEAVEVPTVVECSSRDASRIVEEAQKLNPSKIVVSQSAIYIHTTSTQQASSLVERFGCVAYPDIATMYSEVVKV